MIIFYSQYLFRFTIYLFLLFLVSNPLSTFSLPPEINILDISLEK